MVVVVRGRCGSWCGVVAQVVSVAEVVARVALVAEVVAQVAPVAGVVAQVAPVAGVVAWVALVAVLGTVVGVGVVVVVPARSCQCRRRSCRRLVRPGPRYDTAWSSTSCCCSAGLRRTCIVRDRTGTLGCGSWSSQGAPMRNVGGWLGRTCSGLRNDSEAT